MRAFWIKAINIAVIALLLFMYQTWSRSYSHMSKVIDDLKAQLEEQKQASAGRYKDGTYEGTGKGYKSDIKVRVTVAGGSITDVEIVDAGDDPAYLELASGITGDVVEKQGTEDVDTASGATYSSRGILEGVDNALKGASD
ncbi:MAG: FMN-binding protein [Eubacterium sp.]|nr:FMN-binding protein [Eubacterium sp.]